ncbi:MAG: hypothetical protein ABJE95_35530 [Byssovorax sp.]
MIALQKIVEKLRATAPALRGAVIKDLGVDIAHDAWRSCDDAEVLANFANLVLPKLLVAIGLAACIRELLSQLGLIESPLMRPVAAAGQLSDEPSLVSAVEAALKDLGGAPLADSVDYDAYAAVVNLHKYLVHDETRGIHGVVFFCVESTVSKNYPTWNDANNHVADLLRDATSSFVGGAFESVGWRGLTGEG